MTNWITLEGLTPYEDAQKLMEQRVADIIGGTKDEAIYLLEHEPVYTAGTGYSENELLGTSNIPVIYTGRGGKFTYHGPGQLVIYPIINLNKPNRTKDIKLYVKNLEEWVINTLARIGITAYTIDDMVGIWVNVNEVPSKLGAIGVRVRKWITYHGIAVNISTDLTNYSGIIPCGISNFPVTSLNKLGIEISIKEFSSILKEEFETIFNTNS